MTQRETRPYDDPTPEPFTVPPLTALRKAVNAGLGEQQIDEIDAVPDRWRLGSDVEQSTRVTPGRCGAPVAVSALSWMEHA